MLCHMTVPSCRYLALPGRIGVRYKSPHLWEEGREKMLVTRRKMLGLSAATMGALALAACNNGGGSTTDEGGSSDKALVVATSGLEGKFCPLFTASAADQDVVSFNNITLLITDRMAEPIYNGIDGETKEYNGTEYTYNGPANVTLTEQADGTVTYDVQIRDDLKFHDGTPMTIRREGENNRCLRFTIFTSPRIICSQA